MKWGDFAERKIMLMLMQCGTICVVEKETLYSWESQCRAIVSSVTQKMNTVNRHINKDNSHFFLQH